MNASLTHFTRHQQWPEAVKGTALNMCLCVRDAARGHFVTGVGTGGAGRQGVPQAPGGGRVAAAWLVQQTPA